MTRLSSQWDCLSGEVDEKEAAERPPLFIYASLRGKNFALTLVGITCPNASRFLSDPTILLSFLVRRFFAAPGCKMQLAAGFPASNTYLLVI
jgi:hypothetical protein